MGDLPTRGEASDIVEWYESNDGPGHDSWVAALAQAYRSRDLMTRQEFINSLPSLARLTQHRPYLDHLISQFPPCGSLCEPEINHHDETCVMAGLLGDLKWWLDALGEDTT